MLATLGGAGIRGFMSHEEKATDETSDRGRGGSSPVAHQQAGDQVSSGPASARVLIASDNGSDAGQIHEQLEANFSAVRTSIRADAIRGDFEDFHPEVLVLAFDSLEKANSYASELYASSDKGEPHGHVSVLLCDKEEAREAFDLCKTGVFDDYVLHWPQAQDGRRLTMSVWNAARAVIASRAQGPSRADLAAHLRHLGDLHALIDEEIGKGREHAKVGHESLKRAEQAISAAIDDLSRRWAGSGLAGALASKKADWLLRELDLLKTEPVGRAFQATTAALEPLMRWPAKLETVTTPQLNRLHAIEATMISSGPLLLVVEDNDFARKLIRKMLEGSGYGLAFAPDGATALATLRSVRPELVLMDVNLPDIDGVALVRTLKAMPQLASIPILMLTGESRLETLQDSMRAGALGFLVKPFTQAALLANLNRLLPRRAAAPL